MASEDISFCPKDCNRVKCHRNKKNIKDENIPHSFFIETPPDCPYKKNKPDPNHGIYHVTMLCPENGQEGR